jgi:hypothetical protein
VSGAGDVDGDGYDDFLIASPRENGINSYSGVVYLLYGSSSKLAFGPASDHAAFLGENTYDYIGGYNYHGSMGFGDFDGDGISDTLIGAKDFDAGGLYSTGRAYIRYGAVDRVVGRVPVLGNSDASVTGASSYEYVGTSVNSVGDVNGDGYDDMGVCGYGANSYQGRCAFAWGGAERMAGDTKFADFGAFSFIGAAGSDYLGAYGVAGTDIDQDGHSDVIMSAYYAEPSGTSMYSTGAMYLVRGSADLEGQDSVASADASVYGVANYDYLGNGLSQETGDINGDGYPDIGVGAYGANSYAGGAWFFVGGGM